MSTVVEAWKTSALDRHKIDVGRKNSFIKILNACWRDTAKLLFVNYNSTTTTPASFFIEQNKMQKSHKSN